MLMAVQYFIGHPSKLHKICPGLVGHVTVILEITDNLTQVHNLFRKDEPNPAP